MSVPHSTMKSHGLLAVERFKNDTRHMVEFKLTKLETTEGVSGELIRLFLSEEGYSDLLSAEQRGEIRIQRNALVIEGHIIPEKTKNIGVGGDGLWLSFV